MRAPPGVALILIGSGLYWILSSQLISSFTVLAPGLFQSVPSGVTLIAVAGVISLTIGFWIIHIDFNELAGLFAGSDGWVFSIPIALVVSDVYLTLIALSSSSQIIELNPFVAAAIQFGTGALVPFILCYLALSEGLAMLMLKTGNWLFGGLSSSRFLPFALICGVASFGPFSNLLGLTLGYVSSLVYVLGAVGGGLIATLVYRTMKIHGDLLRPSLL